MVKAICRHAILLQGFELMHVSDACQPTDNHQYVITAIGSIINPIAWLSELWHQLLRRTPLLTRFAHGLRMVRAWIAHGKSLGSRGVWLLPPRLGPVHMQVFSYVFYIHIYIHEHTYIRQSCSYAPLLFHMPSRP